MHIIYNYKCFKLKMLYYINTLHYCQWDYSFINRKNNGNKSRKKAWKYENVNKFLRFDISLFITILIIFFGTEYNENNDDV